MLVMGTFRTSKKKIASSVVIPGSRRMGAVDHSSLKGSIRNAARIQLGLDASKGFQEDPRSWDVQRSQRKSEEDQASLGGPRKSKSRAPGACVKLIGCQQLGES